MKTNFSRKKTTVFSGTFFNFKKIESDGSNVQVELRSGETNQSFNVIANAPHKHLTFTIESKTDSIKDLEKTHGQLGAALLVLILIGMWSQFYKIFQ